MNRAIATVTGLFCLSQIALAADVRLPSVLGDHMVLQRETEVSFWGWAAPGEDVSVHPDWTNEAYSSVATDEGRWRVRFPTPEAGGPYSILVAGNNALTLEDVLVGEVWICSGQSNMEWTLGPGVGPGIANWEDEVASAYYEQIRLFDVPSTTSAAPQADCGGSWLACTPDTVKTFSAVGYLFGRELANELNVPIGLVSTNWGGTVAEAWTSRAGLAPFPAFVEDLDHLAGMAENPGAADDELERALEAWWVQLAEKDPLSREQGWMEARFGVDEEWGTMLLPAPWEPELGNFDGVVWFLREFDLPEEFLYQDLVLELGPIDDMDTTWVNGVLVGKTLGSGRHTMPRKYTVPLRVPRLERNVVAVRTLDTGGAGGFTGKAADLRIGPAAAEEPLSLAGEWRYHVGASLRELGAPPSRSWMHQNRPTVLYNAMLAPLLPLTIRGAIWYQGESNRTRAAQYRELFPALIADWRRSFGQGDFPFYYVQIAPFEYGNDVGEAAELREAQTLTLA
ncbi:MAG: 9-O-acetylesterase, partial [Deltaproteobacteria bacterium]|nr:9-O-acetylesterase [Deltaproteobacteria bacterium]